MGAKQRNLTMGAVAGAAAVATLGVAVGALLGELAHPAVIVGFGLFGAVLGAYAAGALAYERERERDGPDPTAGYSEGVLAEREAEEAKAAEPAEDGLVWLARRRAASFLKLPLNPWI
jgi:hypothetical protein